MIRTEDTRYLLENKDIQRILKNIYDRWISKCLDGTYPCEPWWGQYKDEYSKTGMLPEPLKGAMSQDFYNQKIDVWKDKVSYEAYKWKKDNLRPMDYQASVHEKIWYRPKNRKHFSRQWFNIEFMDDLQEIMTELIKNKWGDYYLGEMMSSNKPMWYKNYKGTEGFMGWHTNSDKPAHRWYLVYNTHNNSSCMRFIDPDTKEIITNWEPKGWTINYFHLGSLDNETWHSVYTKSNRFSFGKKILDVEDNFLLEEENY